MVHRVFLIKSAVNRARLLMREGILSLPAIAALRKGKMLPSVSKVTAGLDRGTLAMMREQGIQVRGAPSGMFAKKTIPPEFKQTVPSFVVPPVRGDVHRFELSSDPADRSWIRKRLREGSTKSPILSGFSPVVDAMVRSGKARPETIPAILGIEKSRDLDAVASLMRRHEVNEARASLYGLRKGLGAPQGPHASPWVLAQEARDVASSSPEVRSFLHKLREKELKGSWKRFKPEMGFYGKKPDLI